MNHTLSNADRRWNNVLREQAARYLELAKRAKRSGNAVAASLAMRSYHRCIAGIRK